MKSRILISVLLSISFCAHAAEKSYPVSDIPGILETNAKAVIRKHTREVRVNDAGEIVISELKAITILKKTGDGIARFTGPYDSFKKYRSIKGKIFNKEGEAEENLRGEDILDLSNISSYSLYEDHRVKLIQPEFHEYPYTVEYSYEIIYQSHLYLPDWMIYPAYNVSVQYASFRLDVPEGFEFRMKPINIDIECSRRDEKGRSVHYWEVQDLPALNYESYSGYLHERAPHILFSANTFELDGRSGDLTSWNSFGKWIDDLFKGKDALPESAVEMVKDLTKDLPADEEKIKVLYKHMQEKVRYVNLTLGIGGLEPIPADQVDKVSYGDCKALSNYMKALLNAAGIKSYIAAVHAGSSHPRLEKDFPSFQFNHVILMVPLEEDSVWLECTSQRLPAGYLGSFTDDRYVLIVSDEGGMLIRTPKFDGDDNVTVLKANVMLDTDCNASIDFRKRYSGLHFGSMQSAIYNNDLVEQKRRIQNRLTLPDFTIDQFAYTVEADKAPFVEEHVALNVTKILFQTGEYVPLDLCMLAEEISLPRRSRTRNCPIYLKRSYTTIDSVRFVIPESLDIYSLPEQEHIVCEFGEYHTSVTKSGNELLFTRKYLSNAGEFSADQFSDLYDFLRKVNTADMQRALLVKKTFLLNH